MKATELLAGMALGAGIMYMLDSNQGARRRGLVRDQFVHAGHKLDDEVTSHGRHLRNRARGAIYEMGQRIRGEEIDDDILVERVRSQLGRAVTNAGSIEVRADNGRVTLSGPVLREEVDNLVSRVRHVRGVHDVENRLDVHEQPDHTPGLQGSR